MSSVRPFTALPAIGITAADERAGRISVLQAQACRTYGPVLRSTVPSGALTGPCACLVGADALRHAYGPGSASLGSALGWLPLIGRRFGTAILNSDDPRHAAERRQWTPAFATRSLARWVPTIDAMIGVRIARWTAAEDIDVYAAARELAFAVVASTVGGQHDDAAVAKLGAEFAEALAPPRDGEDLADHHARVLPVRDSIERTVIDSIDAARRERTACESGSLLALLLTSDPPVETPSVLHALNILLVAGHETSASLLAWILLLAGNAPAWEEQLAAEAARLPAPAAVDPGMLAPMPVHDAFITEAGRLYPPLVNVPRVATRDFTYAGVLIEAGTTVALGVGATDRAADVHAEPHAFRPERYLPDRSPRATQPFTFAHGARTCLGMRFVHLTLKLTLARLLQVAVPVADDARDCVHAGFWNARPRGNLRLRLRRR